MSSIFKKLSIKIVPILLVGASLNGCIDLELDTGIRIDTPQQEGDYVGFYDELPHGADNTLPENIIIHYDEQSKAFDLFLNGYEIKSELISHHGDQATVSMDSVKDFLVQGANTLSINPTSLGPSVTFDVDTEGPSLAIKETCFAGDAECSVAAGEAQVRFSVEDVSAISSVRLQGHEVHRVDGLYQAAVTPVDGFYEFELMDEHGYVSTVSYMANGGDISSIFKARVGESAIKGLTPIIDAGISNQFSQKTEQEVEDSDYLYAGNYGILKLWVKVKSMATGRAYVNDLQFDDAISNLMHIDLSMIPSEETGYVATDKKDGSMLTADKEQVGTYMVMDIYTTCIWANHPDDRASCKTKMMPDMTLLMETLDFTGSIDLMIQNGGFAVAFRDGMSIDMGDIATAEDGTSDFIGMIIDMLKSTDLFQNLTKGLVETVINENLDEIVIGADVVNDTGHSFVLETKAENITTDADDMYIDFSGRIQTTLANPDVPRALGSYYVKDPIPAPINDTSSTVDNFAVTVNANMINQALTSLYSTGSTHLSILGDTIYQGPGRIDDSVGNNTNIKLELIPAGPGIFELTGNDTSQASLSYDEAELRIAMKTDGQWNNMFVINVDISAGVLMEVRDDKFYMTISGSPDFKINSVTNNTILPVNEGLLTWALDKMIKWGIPQVAQTEFEIDIPDIKSDGYEFETEVSTEEFNTEGGHLNFSMGLNPVEPVVTP